MASLKKFCYLEPDFPKEAYSVVLLLGSAELGLSILPLDFIYQNLDDARVSITKAAQEINKDEGRFEIMEAAMLFPITFQKNYPLKKEYWSGNIPQFSIEQKVEAFLPLVDRPYLYKLLVTPGFFDKKEKRWYFNNTYPFSIFAEDQEIEHFMYYSDQPVDTKAKNAAIYTINNPKRFNWESGEVTEVELNLPKIPKIES